MPRHFQPDDIFLHRTISDTDCSPAEPLAAAVVGSLDRANDRPVSKVWAFPLDEGQPWPLSTGGSNETHPRWAPDGQRLAVLSNRGGTVQVYTLPRQGGEASQLTHFDGPVNALAWSPDGARLACIVSVATDPDLRGARPECPLEERAPDAPQLAWKLPYKMDGSGYTLANEFHLYVVDASSGEGTRLTDGAFDVRGACWSPDGQRIAFVRSREGDESHRTDLWVIDAGGGSAKQLTKSLAQVLSPQWSPDGRWIVLSGTVEEGDAQVRLWAVEMQGGREGQLRALGDESLEISTETSSVRFPPGDSSRVLALLARRGVQEVAEIAVPSGDVRGLVRGERQLAGLAIGADWLAYAAQSPVSAIEMHACRHDGTGEKCVSGLNAWWRERALPSVERRPFDVPDGRGGTETIDGWLLRPPGASGATPLVVDSHGGPASFALFDFPAIAYWYPLLSRGFSVLALNAVGSASYGREFSDRLCGHWGEYDLPQYEAVIAALQSAGLADHRLAICGKSYGGFLSAWAIAHGEQFQAAVVMAPVSNIDSHWGTSDSGYYADVYSLAGGRETNRKTLVDLSPTRHAHRTAAATLILQGMDDERCPKCQGEELFVSIKRGRNPPCELVLYPGASHKFTTAGKPSHRLDAVTRIRDWLGTHIGPPAAT